MTDIDDRVAALEREIEKLKAEKEPKLEFKSDWKPTDKTSHLKMPANAVREMTGVVGDRLVAELVADGTRSSKPSSLIGDDRGPRKSQPQRQSGWQELTPIRSPEGVEACDRLVDAQDELDRKQRLKQFGGE
jgi:hypothetical protein